MITTLGGLQTPLGLLYPRYLALAQCWYNPEYRQLILLKKRLGCDIVLDNGAHEDETVSLDRYIEVIDDLRPSTVVLLDIVGVPGRESFDLSMRSLRSIVLHFAASSYAPMFMFCGQGIDKDDVVSSYYRAYDTLDPSKFIIGVGQGYLHFGDSDRENARVRLVEQLRTHPRFHEFRHHILGGRWMVTKTEREYYRGMDNIVSLDTIKPTTCALGNRVYPAAPVERRLNFFDERIPCEAIMEQSMMELCGAYGMSIAQPTVEQLRLVRRYLVDA